MENLFMGVVAMKISGVYLRGAAAQCSCIAGTFRFRPERGEIEGDLSGDGEAYVLWRDKHGHHSVLADEVVGIAWNDEE